MGLFEKKNNIYRKIPELQVLLNPITEEKGFDNFPGLIFYPFHHLEKETFVNVKTNLSTLKKKGV